ncbi:MAG: VOC family protein [Candidatus Berkelbacteria bacterium]
MDLDSAVFYSKDIGSIADFYSNFMGFTLHSRQGDKFVSFIFPNGGKLSIRIEKGEREIAGHQTVFIGVEDIEEQFRQMKEKNAKFYRELETFEWGSSFDILDPDNNKVEFIKYTLDAKE